MNLVLKWIISVVAIGIVSYLLPGVAIEGAFAAVVTALVLGIINVLLKPILVILTLPITIGTLGLFTFVINAVLIQLTSLIVPGFEVKNFGWALIFSFVLSIVTAVLHFITPDPAD